MHRPRHLGAHTSPGDSPSDSPLLSHFFFLKPSGNRRVAVEATETLWPGLLCGAPAAATGARETPPPLPHSSGEAVLRVWPTLGDPGAAACQAPLSVQFSRQEHWSRWPCPPPGEFPDPGTEPRSPPLQADSLPAECVGMSPALRSH